MSNFFPSAQVIADSISLQGVRLTSVQVTTHRFILAELNTHRMFSRNSASSRAIPYTKMRDKALYTPALPLAWPQEQKGMQGGEELNYNDKKKAETVWLAARDLAVEQANELYELGVHKSVINRLLEPFLPHTVLISATDWDNFFEQRISPLAQPEILWAAKAIFFAIQNSKPVERSYSDWHLPYVNEGERYTYDSNLLTKISAARSARVSYETQEGTRDIEKDLELYERLTTAQPAHWSPLEHVAKPAANHSYFANFRGWVQLRTLLGG